MTVSEVIENLSELAPLEYAQKWDNAGLLVGDLSQEVSRIYVAVDATDNVIDDAMIKGADLLLTHHPLIFSGIKQVREDDFVGKRIIKLIKNDIACVAMHTNFDIMGMADAAADELDLKKSEVLHTVFEDDIAKEGFGRIGQLPQEMALEELAELVKKTFGLESVRVFGNLDARVQRVAILPGSGKSSIDDALNGNADVYITGDIDHHDGIDALEKGLCIIDAGHYGIEKLFISYMKDYIERNLKGITVITEQAREPFCVL